MRLIGRQPLGPVTPRPESLQPLRIEPHRFDPHEVASACRYPSLDPWADKPLARGSFPMDRDLSSKIRALALAGRCLAREMKTLREKSLGIEPQAESAVETERLVGLARVILDPAGHGASTPPPAVPNTLNRALEPGQAVPSALPARPGGLGADTAPSAQHILALFGQGTVLPIPELIGFLGAVGKTGILRISTAGETYALEFLLGDIVHGEATSAPEGHRLGDLLVAQDVIDRATLEDVCEKGPSWRLGQTLLKKNLIEKKHLTAALQTQIQWLFNRLFRDEVKSFTFWSGPSICAADGVRLNTTSLLLEGARSSDEVEDGLRAVVETRLDEESS